MWFMNFMMRCHPGCQLAPRWFLLFGKMVILVLIFHPSWKGVYIWRALKIYTWCMEVGNPYWQKASWVEKIHWRQIFGRVVGFSKESPPSSFWSCGSTSPRMLVSTEGLQLGIPSKSNIVLITFLIHEYMTMHLDVFLMPIFFAIKRCQGSSNWFLGLELTNSFQTFRAPWCGRRSFKICFVVVKNDHLLYLQFTRLNNAENEQNPNVFMWEVARCFADKLRGATSHRHIDTLHPVEPRFHLEVFSESFLSFKKRTCGFVQRDGCVKEVLTDDKDWL